MASTNSLTIRPETGAVAFIGGGRLSEVKDYKDGKEAGLRLRNGQPIRRVSGVTAVMDGVPLDGFTVQTTAQIDEIPEGSLLAASGLVEVTIRGEARAGFGDGNPRATLTGSVFVEALQAVGTVADLLAQANRRQGK